MFFIDDQDARIDASPGKTRVQATYFKRGAVYNNVVYIARRQLIIDQLAESLPGAGTFRQFSLCRQLTAPEAQNTSIWELPCWFYPDNGQTPLTYHTDMKRWQKYEDRTELKSVARGQEFVLDCDEYPEAVKWACNLIQSYDNAMVDF